MSPSSVCASCCYDPLCLFRSSLDPLQDDGLFIGSAPPQWTADSSLKMKTVVRFKLYPWPWHTEDSGSRNDSDFLMIPQMQDFGWALG